jgi:hypothetical protein
MHVLTMFIGESGSLFCSNADRIRCTFRLYDELHKVVMLIDVEDIFSLELMVHGVPNDFSLLYRSAIERLISLRFYYRELKRFLTCHKRRHCGGSTSICDVWRKITAIFIPFAFAWKPLYFHFHCQYFPYLHISYVPYDLLFPYYNFLFIDGNGKK